VLPIKVPDDQRRFLETWKPGASTYSRDQLKAIPKDVKDWAGKLLFTQIIDGDTKIFVVEFADHLAFVTNDLPEAYHDNVFIGQELTFSGQVLEINANEDGENRLAIADIYRMITFDFSEVERHNIQCQSPGERYPRNCSWFWGN
jgi:hypothetical protein